MASIQEIRQQYPQYSDMSDDALADAMHKKFYSDMPRDKFNEKIGLPSATILGEVAKAIPRAGLDAADITRALGQGPIGMLEKGTYQPIAQIANYLKPDLNLPTHLLPSVQDSFTRVAPKAAKAIERDEHASAIPRYAGAITEVAANPYSWVGPGGAASKIGLGLLAGAGGQAAEDFGGEPGRIAAGLALPAGVGARAAYGARGGARSPTPRTGVAPVLEDIFESSNNHYQTLRDMDVPLRRDVVSNLAEDIKGNLETDAFYKEDQPRTFRSLDRLISNEGDSSSKQVYAVRTALGRILKDLPGTSDAAAATRAIERLDEYLSNIPGFSETAQAARRDWASAKTSEMVQGMHEKAQRAASASGSGANLDNAMRQQIKSLMNDKKKAATLTPEEKELAEEIIKGGKIGNVARLLSKLGPKHPLSGWGSAIAADFAGGAGTATGSLGLGAIAQWLSEKLTTGKVRKLDEMIRSRSALAQTSPLDAGASVSSAALDQGFPQ